MNVSGSVEDHSDSETTETPWELATSKNAMKATKVKSQVKRSPVYRMENSNGFRMFMHSAFLIMHQTEKEDVLFQDLWDGDKIDDETFCFLTDQYEKWGRKMLSLKNALKMKKSDLNNTRVQINGIKNKRKVRSKDQPSQNGFPNQVDHTLSSWEKKRMGHIEQLKKLESQMTSLVPKCWSN